MTTTNPTSPPPGDARISIYRQTPDMRPNRLRRASCAKICTEKPPDARPDRREPFNPLRTIAPGDVLTATRIDRLARVTFDRFAIVTQQVGAGGQYRSPSARCDTATRTRRLMIAVPGRLERNLVHTRTAGGRQPGEGPPAANGATTEVRITAAAGSAAAPAPGRDAQRPRHKPKRGRGDHFTFVDGRLSRRADNIPRLFAA